MTSSFLNTPTKAEKLRMLVESMKPTTRHQMVGVIDPALGGRYATEANIVSGSAPHVPVPPMPEGSPWGPGPVVPIERPTNQEIDALEPTGTYEEIQRSLASLPEGSSVIGEADGVSDGGDASTESINDSPISVDASTSKRVIPSSPLDDVALGPEHGSVASSSTSQPAQGPFQSFPISGGGDTTELATGRLGGEGCLEPSGSPLSSIKHRSFCK